jgi:hypothetical protein
VAALLVVTGFPLARTPERIAGLKCRAMVALGWAHPGGVVAGGAVASVLGLVVAEFWR